MNMAKLLVFVPCEKIILDDQGNASLIVLFHSLDARGTTGDIPKNAVTPKEWAIFTMWQWLPEERGKEFSQIIQILWPDGTEFKRFPLEFKAGERKYHQNRVNIVGFPIGQIGEITVNMWLEENSRRFGDTYSYSLAVSHARAS